MGCPVLGRTELASGLRESYPELIVAVGASEQRLELSQRFLMMGFGLPVLVHPKAFVSNSVCLGGGTVVFAQAVVNAGATVGHAGIINTAATIDHDCVLEEAVHVSPGAHLAGNVRVGCCTWIGIGACVIQNIRIGMHSVVAAGAVVTCDLGDRQLARGVPAYGIERTQSTRER